LPYIEASPSTIVTNEASNSTTITINTKNGGNADLGYTAILLNSDAGRIQGNAGVPGNVSPIVKVNSYNSSQSQAVVGKNQFIFTSIANLPNDTAITTRMIIIGNETGGRFEIDITVNPITDAQSTIVNVRTFA
jgi:hypothetical protein